MQKVKDSFAYYRACGKTAGSDILAREGYDIVVDCKRVHSARGWVKGERFVEYT